MTPTRNEAWTLPRFLATSERWAHDIVIADQRSDDGTRDLARKNRKVTLVDNPEEGYDEGLRRRTLLEGARTLDGPRVVLAVDADEALSANAVGSHEWGKILGASPGTVITADWINYLPGFDLAWVPREPVPIGLVDDGRPHNPGPLHGSRVLVRPEDPVVHLREIKLLHFQYVDWARMESKQRRYQVLETLTNPTKRAVQIYRQYHRSVAFPDDEVIAARPEWLAGYEEHGIDMRLTSEGSICWWDHDVLEQLIEHGARRFRRLDIWDHDWSAVARHSGVEVPEGALSDPRSRMDRAIHRWLAATQDRAGRPDVRAMQRMLIPLGW
jgi:hypothetical protein